ncbi:hypothetical protein [Wolbachia endosymbiont (group A) of Ennomos erosarius]|uniref:hypothetical protein n=1 Tax=Wolbachia endosymbiont (group A) of Ennomos erosarius TaxID=3066174 RepID=UPI003340A03A
MTVVGGVIPLPSPVIPVPPSPVIPVPRHWDPAFIMQFHHINLSIPDLSVYKHNNFSYIGNKFTGF